MKQQRFKKEPKKIDGLIDDFLTELQKKRPENYSDNTKRIKMIYKIAFHKLKWDKKQTFQFIMNKFPKLEKRMNKGFKEDKLHYSLGATFISMNKSEMSRCVCIFLGLERQLEGGNNGS